MYTVGCVSGIVCLITVVVGKRSFGGRRTSCKLQLRNFQARRRSLSSKIVVIYLLSYVLLPLVDVFEQFR